MTVFCQGHPFDHAVDFHSTLRRIASAPDVCGGFLWLGHVIDTDDADGQTLFRSWSKNRDGRGLDLIGFHRALFETDGPAEYTFHLGAQFAVSRASIRARSLEFWARALHISENFPDRVFGIQGIDTSWLNGRKTVYLKPIRRLQEAVACADGSREPCRHPDQGERLCKSRCRVATGLCVIPRRRRRRGISPTRTW